MATLNLWFPHITHQSLSPQGSFSGLHGQPPLSVPLGANRPDISNGPDESEALHLCNHRQLVPSDYVPLNAVLSTVARCNTERDYTMALPPR